MQKEDFKKLRKVLGKTQKDMAELLSVSKKTVESYEQGLRNIPPNVQRMIYFLVFKLNIDKVSKKKTCWNSKRCPPKIRENCVAWLAKEGFYCWFITGRVCSVEASNPSSCCDSCFECDFFRESLDQIMEKTGVRL
jgi:transcriptional regulator with XRE-family HTH domain